MDTYFYYSRGTGYDPISGGVEDDVALTKAKSLDDACRIFSKFYDDASPENVHIVNYNYYNVCVISGY